MAPASHASSNKHLGLWSRSQGAEKFEGYLQILQDSVISNSQPKSTNINQHQPTATNCNQHQRTATNSPCDLRPPEAIRRPRRLSLGPAATPPHNTRVSLWDFAVAVWDKLGQSQADTDAWLLVVKEAVDMAFWAKRERSVCFLSY